MRIVNLIQGSPEWLEHRRTHFNASEAAAMLGLDPKTKRNELLDMKATGNEKVFSNWVQENILDYGHEVEAMARPIVERMIGESLYPITATDDDSRLSCSCDGLTMMETIGFEHKQWNQELVEAVRNGVLPDDKIPQVQQCLMITRADKWIFAVSDGTEDNFVSVEVYPSQEWFDRIKAGWDQFEKDLADYVPPEVVIKPVAETMMSLPAVAINVSGSLIIKTNLDVFGEQLTAFVGGLNLKPKTDQDFANSESAIKILKQAEEALTAGEANALAQASSVDELRRTVEAYYNTARDTRLMLEKLVDAEKKARRAEIVNEGIDAYNKHIYALEEETKPIRLQVANVDFLAVIKGLKTITSVQNAVDTLLANAKIAADAIAKDIRVKLTWYNDHAKEHKFLFNDLQQIIYKPADDFNLLVKTRISEHQNEQERKMEAERARIRLEEAAKARLEESDAAHAKALAEEKAKQEEKPAVSTETTQSVVPVSVATEFTATAAEPIQQAQKPSNVRYFDGTQPSNEDIIDVVAKAYGANPETAQKWLQNAFGMKAAA
jgi:predicted phage-related endonuclease